MILTGLARLGRDAEVRHLPEGTAVANLSLAYNYGKKDSEGKRPTQWVNAALWGERAEKLAEYLTKGSLISVVLEDVCIESYERKDGGGTGTNLKARIVSIEFAGGKREESPAQERTQPAATKPPSPEELPVAADFVADRMIQHVGGGTPSWWPGDGMDSSW